MGPRTVATKQDRNSCSGTSAGSRERSSWVGIPNYKRVLSHNQTKSYIYVSDTSRLVIRWDLVYKNMGQALTTRPTRRLKSTPRRATQHRGPYIFLSPPPPPS